MRFLPACLLLTSLCLAPAAIAEDAPPAFVGQITYTQSAEGESSGAKLFRGLAAARVVVYIGKDAYRQDEVGGMNEGSVIRRNDAKVSLFLNHTKKTAERGGGVDLDQNAAAMKKLLPWHFDTDLEELAETDTICGYPVRRYRVKQSGFVKKGATAHLWITTKLHLPRRRFQSQFKSREVISPLPLSIPITRGAILKVEVLDGGVPVTAVATEVVAGEPEAALFDKPEGYAGKGFPTAAEAEAAREKGPVRTPMTKEALAALPKTLTTSSGIELALIQPGSFLMGSDPSELKRRDDELQRKVTITRPYYMGIHEVTQAQWRAVMGADSPAHFKGDALPVEKLTWVQANAFCAACSKQEKRTVRLPTEAEWEYAARAGETRSITDRKAQNAWARERAWFYDTAKYKTHPVGTLKPNAWGLFDMHGNVAEWTAVGYGDYRARPEADPLGVTNTRKVVRGGGWVASAEWLRPAARTSQEAAQGKSTIGFRVVIEP